MRSWPIGGLLRGLSLKRRITLSVAVGLAFVLAIFGYVSLWAVEQSTQSVFAERQSLAQTTAAYVDSAIGHAQQEVEELALLLAQAKGAEAQKATLALQQPGHFLRLVLLDEGGQVLAQEPPGSSPMVYPCARPALLRGGSVATQLAPAAVGRPPFGCLASPLPDGGVLVAIFDPRAARNRLLAPVQAGSTISMEILDSEGAVVAATQPDYPAWADHMVVLSDLVRKRTPGVRVHEMPEGSPQKTHIVAYAPLSNMPPWGVTVEQDVDVALDMPRELQGRMLIFGALILVLGSGLAWFDVRRVVKPLEMLTSASARMAAGDLESPIITTRQDEVGDLATTFDVMRVKLRNSLEEIGRWNRELGERVNQRTQELSALFEASQTLTSTLSLIRDERETYAQLTTRIASIAGAEKCLIALWQEGDQFLGQSPGYGVPQEAISDFRYDHPGLEAPCIVDRQTPAFGDAVHGLLFLEAFAANTVLTVPLKVQGKTIGIIYAADKAAGFTEHDARLLSIVASQAAVAVENARLYGELQRKEEIRRRLLDKVLLAQEEERKRISRELHDDVGQPLTALVMNLGAVEESLGDSQGELRERLSDIRELASDTLVEIRRLMLDLRPTMLDDMGLIPAISWYVENHLTRANIKPHLEVSGFQGNRLPAQMETVLFRVVQEAITNIVKHSGASQATICLEVVNSRLKATIEDNGRGFEVREAPVASQGTLGLTGMEERVNLIGGTLHIESQPGKGTRLSLEIPLAEETL